MNSKLATFDDLKDETRLLMERRLVMSCFSTNTRHITWSCLDLPVMSWFTKTRRLGLPQRDITVSLWTRRGGVGVSDHRARRGCDSLGRMPSRRHRCESPSARDRRNATRLHRGRARGRRGARDAARRAARRRRRRRGSGSGAVERLAALPCARTAGQLEDPTAPVRAGHTEKTPQANFLRTPRRT